jgi:DNA gyrase/topoisomerase IV subunit B
MRKGYLRIKLPSDAWDRVRERPGMYFGYRGSKAIPLMIMQVIHAVLNRAQRNYHGLIEVSMTPEEQAITFQGLGTRVLDVRKFARWIEKVATRKLIVRAQGGLPEEQSRQERVYPDVMITALGSKIFTIRKASRTNLSRFTSRPGNLTVSSKATRSAREPFLRIEFQQDKAVFAEPRSEEIWRVAGALRDVSVLRPALTTRLRLASGHCLQFYYERGIESALMEEDHQRWPIYDGILKAAGARGGLRFECCIRFVHAGVPRVKSWVNRLPTQGGSHVKGIGRALSELFPEYDKGCRTLPLMVDTDSKETIMLPRALVGMLHVETELARYKGPTKDVLDDGEVEAFIYKAAREQFQAQWVRLKGERAL